jgi:hypothetical protein
MRRLGCSPLWFDPGNRTVLSVQNLGPTVVPGRPSRAAPATPAAASTLDCGISAPVGTAMVGASSMAGKPGDCTSRTFPEPCCLALAPLVAATGVALGAFRRRGFIDYDSDAIRLRNPTRSRRLTESRACVGDHLRPVTGGTDGSRYRRLGSLQSSREVPAETQEGPAGTGRGWGHSGRIGVPGGRSLRGWSPDRESGLAAGGAGQGRGRPPPATRRHLCPGPLRP